MPGTPASSKMPRILQSGSQAPRCPWPTFRLMHGMRRHSNLLKQAAMLSVAMHAHARAPTCMWPLAGRNETLVPLTPLGRPSWLSSWRERHRVCWTGSSDRQGAYRHDTHAHTHTHTHTLRHICMYSVSSDKRCRVTGCVRSGCVFCTP